MLLNLTAVEDELNLVVGVLTFVQKFLANL